MRIVLGVSGGIAAYKAVHLLRLLREQGHQVDVVPTAASLEFVGAATWEAISSRPVTTGVFSRVDEVRHVRLGQQADLVVVAPATADLLARVRAGRADDLLTSTLLATQAPVILVPAMHTEMWGNPATAENVEVLRARGIEVMEPASGRLTGTDSGPGRLPEPEDIHRHLQAFLADPAPMSPAGASEPADHPVHDEPLRGRRVVVTAGGTREALDPVRFLGNRSSGRQGIALARAARQAGADVHLILGTLETEPPASDEGISLEHIESAQQLGAAVAEASAECDMLIMAAAVADFRPLTVGESKIKKTDDGQDPTITLTRNPDILAETVAARSRTGKGPTVIVGFAAETGDAEHDPVDLAGQKLQRKSCDLLVLNQVGTDLVFGREDTEVHILASQQSQQVLGAEPLTVAGSKTRAAQAVVAQASRLL